MDNISLIPDMYTPSVDTNGNYIDKIPKISNGIHCPCGSRRHKVYNSNNFGAHMKSKVHRMWLQQLNNNKANYYAKLIKAEEIIEQQKLLLVKLENQIQTKSLTIDFLTNQLVNNTANNQSVDLLDIDN